MAETTTPAPHEHDRFASHGKGDSAYVHVADKVTTSVLGFAVALTLGFPFL